MGPRAAIAGLLAVLAVAPVACGGPPDPPVDPPIPGPRLTVYSGQPLSGYEGDRARDVVDAERLALSEAGGRVGRWAIRYVALDDSDPGTGRWEPGLVAANARRAAQDPTTIAYLGEMDAGASAVAVPVLNEEGILTLSPLDGLAGLTARRGAGQGEPDKYFPTRRRTFGRIVPGDDVQAAAVLDLPAGPGRQAPVPDPRRLPVRASPRTRRPAPRAGGRDRGRGPPHRAARARRSPAAGHRAVAHCDRRPSARRPAAPRRGPADGARPHRPAPGGPAGFQRLGPPGVHLPAGRGGTLRGGREPGAARPGAAARAPEPSSAASRPRTAAPRTRPPSTPTRR